MVPSVHSRPAVAVLLGLLIGLALLLGACSAAAIYPTAAAPNGGERPAATPAARPADDEQPGFIDANLPDGALVVRTGELRLEVDDLPAAVEAGARAVGLLGGYVGASREQHTSVGGWASVTYRIPVHRWDEAIAGLRGVGKVVDQQTDSSDVTSEVVDLDARISNLRSTEAAMQAIMQRANTIPDVLKVQGELTAVRGQIERLVAQRDGLAQRAALATLSVRYEVPVAPAAQVREGWDLGRELDAATTSLVVILQRLTSLGVWLGIVVLPVVLPVALVAYAIYRIVRSRQIRATMQASDPRG